MRLLGAWVINTAVLIALSYVLPGIRIRGFADALVMALVLGLLNALVRPIVMLITSPLRWLTLGLFTLVVNGLMFWWATHFVSGFHVASFSTAVIAAFVYSLLSWLVGGVVNLRRR